MAQVTIYGLRAHLTSARAALSRAIHGSLVEALALPEEKRFQRFIALDPDDFLYPADRSERYTVVEISLFEGRSDAAKRQLIRLLFERCRSEAGIAPQDLEITLFETPRANWGIRGQVGDELGLAYRVDV